MDVEPTVCLSPADVDIICVAPKKKVSAPSHIWTDKETGVFLSLMQGDETTIGYFNRMKQKRFSQKKMPRTKAMEEIVGLMRAKGYGFFAIFHHAYSRRVTGVIRLCHPYLFYSFKAEKFNSFYSKNNEWPHCPNGRPT